jgi:methionyl-tRNA formyltransferase
MNKALKIIFAGTPEFAASILQSLIDSPHQIIAVYTQPDRPAGRGLQLTQSAVKKLALQHELPLHQPSTLKEVSEQKILADLNADLMVVAAYGLLLPQAVLDTPHLGCINVHTSLLPRWRGAAPIQRAILAGDAQTGITIMQMNAGMDTGDILTTQALNITATDTSESLHHRLAALGGPTLLEALAQLDKLTPIVQDERLVTHAAKIKKDEGKINWQRSATQISQQIRAFFPWPVAFSHAGDETLRIFTAEVLNETSKETPGTLFRLSAKGMDVSTQQGVLRILRLQLPGGKILSIEDFFNANHQAFVPGTVFA